jgi:hypothetical protein
MAYLVDYTDICGGCGADTKVVTYKEWILAGPEECMPGDVVYCTVCACQGWVDVDDHGIFTYWPEEICRGCHAMYERKLESLTARIRAELLGEGYLP